MTETRPARRLAAAGLTYLLNVYFIKAFSFDFGFMNILVNAVLTIIFLTIIQKKNEYATGQ